MKQVTEAIILAGGFGTRLQGIVADIPKPMAPINNVPFLSYLMKKLIAEGIEHIILCTGYMHEKIEGFYGNTFKGAKISYSQETTPLGTGGAILYALDKALTNDVLALNGDTLFNINIQTFTDFYFRKNTLLAIALRKEKDVSRYGAVIINDNGKITAFTEKNESSGEGFINGGIYLLNKDLFKQFSLPQRFSFEKEVLEKIYRDIDVFGLPFDDYFIDIGIPEDYARAQKELISKFEN